MLLSVFPVCVVPVILPLIKVLLGSKRQALNFLDIYILVILVSKQFATFLHISLSHSLHITNQREKLGVARWSSESSLLMPVRLYEIGPVCYDSVVVLLSLR